MPTGILHDLLLRLRALAHRRRLDADVDDELAFHLEMRASQIESTGVDPEAARRAARRQFGNTTSISFGFGSFRLFISSTYSSTERTCSRGL